MAFGNKLARGVLQGLSGYYGEIARMEAEERKAQILADREAAFAALKSEKQRHEAAQSGSIRPGLDRSGRSQGVDGAAESSPRMAGTRKTEAGPQPDLGLRNDAQRLLREYPSATPGTHPGLFRDGRRIPHSEALEILRRAYRR
jgi:hypothetical protein